LAEKSKKKGHRNFFQINLDFRVLGIVTFYQKLKVKQEIYSSLNQSLYKGEITTAFAPLREVLSFSGI